MESLIIVSNRSPVSDFYKGSGPITVGGLATALHGVAKERKAKWFFATDSNVDLAEYESPASLDYTLSPVLLSKKEYKSYYGGYSNALIWPLFHYFPDKCKFSEEDWINYQSVNRKFAVQILDVIEQNPHAKIWIHDYHLFLVAKYLRQFGVKNQIGFFLHIPFPTYEVFRILPQREAIMEGFLSFDLLGFHTKSYVTNFFRSARNITKEAKINETESYVEFRDRQTYVENFPISIDSKMIKQLTNVLDDESPDSDSVIRLLAPNTKVGLGVDRLDYSKGILERFKAIEYFLKKNPKYRGKFSFVQIAVPSRGSVEDYQVYKSQCEEIVSRINGQFGTVEWQPIIYINRSIPFDVLVKYYRMADFALVTPLRDGMNLVAKEFVLAHKPDAALILSELAGTAEEFTKVALVNPYNQEQIAAAMKHCLENPGYQKAVLEDYDEYLMDHDVHQWAQNFISELNYPGSKSKARLKKKSNLKLVKTQETYAEALSN